MFQHTVELFDDVLKIPGVVIRPLDGFDPSFDDIPHRPDVVEQLRRVCFIGLHVVRHRASQHLLLALGEVRPHVVDLLLKDKQLVQILLVCRKFRIGFPDIFSHIVNWRIQKSGIVGFVICHEPIEQRRESFEISDRFGEFLRRLSFVHGQLRLHAESTEFRKLLLFGERRIVVNFRRVSPDVHGKLLHRLEKQIVQRIFFILCFPAIRLQTHGVDRVVDGQHRRRMFFPKLLSDIAGVEISLLFRRGRQAARDPV